MEHLQFLDEFALGIISAADALQFIEQNASAIVAEYGASPYRELLGLEPEQFVQELLEDFQGWEREERWAERVDAWGHEGIPIGDTAPPPTPAGPPAVVFEDHLHVVHLRVRIRTTSDVMAIRTPQFDTLWTMSRTDTARVVTLVEILDESGKHFALRTVTAGGPNTNTKRTARAFTTKHNARPQKSVGSVYAPGFTGDRGGTRAKRAEGGADPGSVLGWHDEPLVSGTTRKFKYRVLKTWVVLVPKTKRQPALLKSLDEELGKTLIKEAAKAAGVAATSLAGPLVGTFTKKVVPMIGKIISAELGKHVAAYSAERPFVFELGRMNRNGMVPMVPYTKPDPKATRGTGPRLWAWGGATEEIRLSEGFWAMKMRGVSGPSGIRTCAVTCFLEADVRYSFVRTKQFTAP